jgi:hypothetical protein
LYFGGRGAVDDFDKAQPETRRLFAELFRAVLSPAEAAKLLGEAPPASPDESISDAASPAA